MITFLIMFTVSLIWTGLTDGSDVTQSPSILWKQKAKEAQINCSHTKGSSFYQMYWYRQLPGEGIKQIVFTTSYGDPDYGDFSKDKYPTVKTVAESGSFTVKTLETGDNGMYFCAVSEGTKSSTQPAFFGKGTKLTVLDPKITVTEPTVKVLPPSTEEGKGKGKKKTLVCVATGFYPDHVTVSWTKNEEGVDEGVGTDSEAKRDDNTNKYSITSRLKVLNTEWHKRTNEFKCTVFFYNGSVNKTVSNKIKGNPEGAEYEAFNFESLVKSSRNAKLAYIILIAKSTFYGFVIMALIWKFQDTGHPHPSISSLI